MKFNILKPALAALVLVGTACTANYLDINTNPYEPSEDDMQTDGYIIGSALTSLASTVVSTDVNTAQFTDVLLGGPMGGYYSTTGGFTRTIMNYNPTDDWTNVFMYSDRTIPVLYSNLRELKKVTDDPIVLAIADIIKVAAMHRVTDTYGPIPYSMIGENGQIQVPYDSQEKVYDKFFEELDAAIKVLTEHRTDAISAKADYIYGGSAEKWCKLANSLKLRLAMRIVYANEAKAREMAESAVNSEVGVITSNADNARLTSFGADGNPIYVAVNYNKPADCITGGDTHAAADIICYMNGYSDPRREKYFTQSEWPGQTYVGIRRGIVIPPLASVGRKYSGVNISISSPVTWMNAAEVAFLKAEAKGVFGFNMGSGEAKDFYDEGIRLSFEEWGVSGADTYLANTTGKPQLYAFRSRFGEAVSPEAGVEARFRMSQPKVTVTSSIPPSTKYPYTNAASYDGRIAYTGRTCHNGDWVLYTFDEPVRCRRMEIRTGYIQLPRCIFEQGYMEVSEDGETFRRVCDLQNGIGVVDAPRHAIKAVRIVSTKDGNGAAFVTLQSPWVYPVLE